VGNRRVRRFKPEDDERAINVVPEAEITEEEAAEIAARFVRKYRRDFPRLAAAVNAESEEDADNPT